MTSDVGDGIDLPVVKNMYHILQVILTLKSKYVVRSKDVINVLQNRIPYHIPTIPYIVLILKKSER